VRHIDGFAMFALPLGQPNETTTVGAGALEGIPLAQGVDKAWFASDPPPLPDRGPVPPEWMRLYRAIESNQVGGLLFRPPDLFRAWNSVFAGDPCKHRILHFAPGQLFLYDPVDGQPRPPYRFLPDASLPSGLVTNQIGWRGPAIEAPRRDTTVRIVFVGASTTLDAPHYPYSWSEFVGHWLNLWAKSRGLAVHFETLNAGRESIVSTDIAAVVRTEVLPLRPDLVVYYEGANQFRPHSLVEKPPGGWPAPASPPAGSPSWLRTAARYSALLARLQVAAGLAGSSTGGRERPKPDYRLVWPAGLDEVDPDLSYPDLPVNLGVIQHDLEQIRGDLAAIGSDFALSSFVWMVKDGLLLDPIRHRYILEQLNIDNYPFRYRDLERLARFQNRVLAKYAAQHGLPFVDIARYEPFDPDLFIDAVHTTYAGGRLRGWVAFNQLLPTIEKHLADGSWPRPWPKDVPQALPTFTPRHIVFNCGQ
jgi:hypothetical protein